MCGSRIDSIVLRIQLNCSGGSRILKRGVPVCTWLLYLAKYNKVHKARLLGGMHPQENFEFQTF